QRTVVVIVLPAPAGGEQLGAANLESPVEAREELEGFGRQDFGVRARYGCVHGYAGDAGCGQAVSKREPAPAVQQETYLSIINPGRSGLFFPSPRGLDCRDLNGSIDAG